MGLIGLSVALNLVGLLAACRAMIVIVSERANEHTAGEREGSLSAAGVGVAALFVGGFMLMAAGQFQALALFYLAPEDRLVAEVDSLTKVGLLCGAVLVAIGSVLARSRRPAAPGTANATTAAADAPGPRMTSTVLVALAAVIALAGLNFYQYVSHDREAFEAKLAAHQQKPPKLVETNAALATADEQISRAYARRFHDHVFAKAENRPRWFGIETLQNPNDAWIQQELIYAVKPDFIVETGTYNGGSALMWAMILREINPKGRVLTVDIADTSAEARKKPIWKERIDFFLGSSTDPQIVADITKRVSGGRVLVILDSHHGYEHVLQELKMYSPLVDVDSYIVVQDTYIDYPPAFHPQLGAGPWKAVDEFVSQTYMFEIDTSRERMLFTFNPRSQLKRVK